MKHGCLDEQAGMDSPVHRLDARLKIVLTLVLVIAIVSTPVTAGALLAGFAAFLGGVFLLSRLPAKHVLSRLGMVIPFVGVAALFIPFLPDGAVSGGYNLGTGGAGISHSGLQVFWNVLSRSLLSALAVILLTSSTPFSVLLEGLAWWRVPRLFIMILSFAYRYVFVLGDEAQRMKRARDARCYSGQWLWQAQVIGQMIGTLFLRSYERGERVYLAMLARGFEGGPPSLLGSRSALERPHGARGTDSQSPNSRSILAACRLGVSVPRSQEPPPWAVEVKALSYSYPDGTPALQGVSLKVAKGERVALIGANGAGKSTLLLHLNGILQSSAVAVGGLPASGANLARIRQSAGLAFQNPDDQLFCPTVFEDVAFGPRNLRLAAAEVEARVRESLGAVGLAGCEKRSAFHLSIGQKRRAALATVLALRPEILMLDEPSSHLDPRGRRELGGLLKRIGGTQLIATHDLELAVELCTRAIVLEKGRVLTEGEPAKLLRDSAFLQAHGLA